MSELTTPGADAADIPTTDPTPAAAPPVPDAAFDPVACAAALELLHNERVLDDDAYHVAATTLADLTVRAASPAVVEVPVAAPDAPPAPDAETAIAQDEALVAEIEADETALGKN